MMESKYVTVDMPVLIKFFMDNVNMDNMDEKGNYPLNFKFDINTFAKFIEDQSTIFGEREDIEFGTYIIDDEESFVKIHPDGEYQILDRLDFIESLSNNINLTDKIDG